MCGRFQHALVCSIHRETDDTEQVNALMNHFVAIMFSTLGEEDYSIIAFVGLRCQVQLGTGASARFHNVMGKYNTAIVFLCIPKAEGSTS